jgi:hypothetical protein
VNGDTLALRFHHVPVVVVGDATRLEAFRSLVVEDEDDATDAVAEPITIRLLGSPKSDVPAFPPGVHVAEDHRLHVVDDGVHAALDLSSQTIDLFDITTGPIAPQTAVGRTLSLALSLALRERGFIALHAAAVLIRERALLLVGDSGAGKSTTALALVEAGCVPMTDDQVFLKPAEEAWDLFSVPQEFRVTEKTLTAFPQRKRHRRSLLQGYDKYELAVAEFSRPVGRYSGSVQLLFPRKTSGTTTRLSSMSTAEALGELMVSSPLVTVGDDIRTRGHARVLAALAHSNATWLELGSDMLSDPSRTALRVISALAAHWAR